VLLLVCFTLLVLLGSCAPASRLPSRPGPALEAQFRLLQHARLAHTQGQHETAIGLLHRLIESHPQSPLLPEARWWLAHSYDQQGDLKEALAQYRLIALGAKEGPHTAEAQRRAAELERLLGIPPPATGLTALFVRVEQLPPIPDWPRWMETVSRAGISTLVLEVTANRPVSPGVYFQTGLATVHQDVVGALLPIAHRNGVAVFAAVTPRRLAWIAPGLGWNDWSFDAGRQDLQPSGDLDLFHPAFQEYLAAWCADLAATGVDGVLFRADAPLGPADGLSPFALRAFERDFGIPLEPSRMFTVAPPRERADYAPEFWRWAGWRAREMVRVLDRMKNAMHRQSPKLRVAVELHAESVIRPLDALVQYGEDLLEAKRGRFDYYVITTGSAAATFQVDLPGIAEQTLGLLGEPQRIWMTAAVPDADLAQMVSRIAAGGDRLRLPKNMGLVYVRQPTAIP
jgi:hypothetical protein